MAYPKPLSKKTIDKMFSSWDRKTVDTLHIYFEAFANLYGIVQLKDAWKVFKKFEPKIHKKQFLEFSEIVKREDVPYYIIEADELFTEERRIDTDRFIIRKDIVGNNGSFKYYWAYEIYQMQEGKPYYDKPDLLEVAAHPYYDEKLRPFIDELIFYEGENKGKKFSKAYFLTYWEKSDLEYYKSEHRRAKILKRAEIPFSQKFFDYLIMHSNGEEDPLNYGLMFLKENGYVFESDEKLYKFAELMQEFINNSHLWGNSGHTPAELFESSGSRIPQSISFGSGIKKAFADGTIDKDELVRQIREMGIDVLDD